MVKSTNSFENKSNGWDLKSQTQEPHLYSTKQNR